uniref:Secreted protein n=1 Tax=Schistosoma mansoni TaxID=6183 RepID=A0A5K4F8N7_SCHMA
MISTFKVICLLCLLAYINAGVLSTSKREYEDLYSLVRNSEPNRETLYKLNSYAYSDDNVPETHYTFKPLIMRHAQTM